MHGHKHIKKFLKIAYLLSQTILFITGFTIAFLTVSLYLKEHLLLKIPFKALTYSQIFAYSFVATSIVGYAAFIGKKQLTIFIYVALTLFLMNFQTMIALEVPLLVDKTKKWGNARWDELSKGQIIFLQKSMGCCGYEDDSDRSAGDCKNEVGCAEIIKNVVVAARDGMIKCWIALFFLESLSICVILLLKMKFTDRKSR
ncbi:hypothetical protein COBT_002570 [Conglomerata obtusa]